MKPISLPYRILTTLLYGSQQWLSRHSGGTVVVPVAALATALQTRSDKIALAVAFLKEIGLLEHLRYQSHWFEAQVKLPAGMDWTPRSTNVLDTESTNGLP